jgi:hypothetical protein
MSSHQTSLVALALAFAACSAATCPPALAAPPPSVKLTVTPAAPRFAPGAPIKLVLDLHNVGTTALRVSPIPDGNLRIVSLQRDGAPVGTTDHVINYSASLKTAFDKSLVTLAPGAHAQGGWTSTIDPDQGTPALAVVHYDPEGVHRVLLRGVSTPGIYTMHVIYRLGDPWGRPTDVFTGETNLATVKFVVGP